MKYVELCAGAGGSRAGFQAAGWDCALAVDIDEDASKVHRLAFGSCETADVSDLTALDLPDHDVLVAGFPCQPFSSSGTRSGHRHKQGTVFDQIADLAAEAGSRRLLLENVQGLLSNMNGYTFARVLARLTDLGYLVEWAVVNAQWLGVPQSRPRVLISATLADGIPFHEGHGPLFSMVESFGGSVGLDQPRPIQSVLTSAEPQVGKRKPPVANPFGAAGTAGGSTFRRGRLIAPLPLPAPSVGEICCPNLPTRDQVRSVRYWGHSGRTLPYLKKEPVSHSIGTNIGASPLLGVPLAALPTAKHRKAALAFANWSKEETDILAFRIAAPQALPLFGPHTSELARAFQESDLPSTRQYRLLGNLIAPAVSRAIAEEISSSQSGQRDI